MINIYDWIDIDSFVFLLGYDSEFRPDVFLPLR